MGQSLLVRILASGTRSSKLAWLLVALVLEQWQLLSKPLLYLSLFFKRHRDDYYRHLNAVRVDGNWEGWTDFFLDGVATIAGEGVASAQDLFALVTADRARVLEQPTTSVAAVRLFELLPRHPLVSVASVVKLLETSKPTAARAIDALAGAGVLVETTGKKRDRWFSYLGYLERFRVGTDLDVQRRTIR